jgi:hypothetical protein
VIDSLSDHRSNTYVVLLSVAERFEEPEERHGFLDFSILIGLETVDEKITYAYAWQTQRPHATQAAEGRHARLFFALRTRN